MEPTTHSGHLIDSQHPDIQAFAQRIVGEAQDPFRQAVLIYYAIRDGWRYNPYQFSTRPDALRASAILQKDEGHCLDKAILMVATLRAIGIPARLCLAKVRNHIAVERIIATFGHDELVPHGYVDCYLEGKWVKATPAFNQELCEKLGVDPLEFDGQTDSMFQQFDRQGGVFMEYLESYGEFEDVPFVFIQTLMHTHYPHVFATGEEEITRAHFFPDEPSST